MNNFLSIFKAENVRKSLENILSRFTLSMLLSIVITFLSIYIIYLEKESISKEITELARINISLFLTFFISVWTYIFWESYGLSKVRNTVLQLVAIILWFMFYLYFEANPSNFENYIFFMISFICAICFIFFAPYVKKIFNKKEEIKKTQENYYAYFSAILYSLSTAILIWWIIFILTSIWLFTIDVLFKANIWWRAYWYAFSIAFSLIASAIWLNSIPQKESFEKGNYNENHFSLFLIKYVLIPFIFAYFVILYVYSAKVLIDFSNWPRGEISWLVIIFSTFWYFTYILSYIYEEKIHLIKIFRKYFPFVVLPQIFMLFYSIFLRINQYNLTVNRYFVLLFGFWLLFITIYFIFSKRKYLAFIVFSLFSFSTVISVWPWSVYKLPETLQTEELKKDLKFVWILKENGEIIPFNDKEKGKNKEILEKRREIENRIRYICNWHNCEKLIKDLKLEWKIKENYAYNLHDYLDSSYYEYSYIDKNGNFDVLNIYFPNIDERKEIKWYEYHYSQIPTYKEKTSKNYIYLNFKEKKIYVYENWENIDILDFTNIIEKIIKEYWEIWSIKEKLEKPLIFELEWNKIKAKLFINGAYFRIKDWKTYESDDNFRNTISWEFIYSKK